MLIQMSRIGKKGGRSKGGLPAWRVQESTNVLHAMIIYTGCAMDYYDNSYF